MYIYIYITSDILEEISSFISCESLLFCLVAAALLLLKNDLMTEHTDL